MKPIPKEYYLYQKVLKNKWVLVTGCNRGVGWGCLVHLINNNANIILVCRNQLDETIEKCKILAKQSNSSSEFKGI